eukprot:7380180-Prymnesium_polylepis.3
MVEKSCRPVFAGACHAGESPSCVRRGPKRGNRLQQVPQPDDPGGCGRPWHAQLERSLTSAFAVVLDTNRLYCRHTVFAKGGSHVFAHRPEGPEAKLRLWR